MAEEVMSMHQINMLLIDVEIGEMQSNPDQRALDATRAYLENLKPDKVPVTSEQLLTKIQEIKRMYSGIRQR